MLSLTNYWQEVSDHG